MTLVLVEPGDLALFFVTCPHCRNGFGKGTKSELAFEAWDQKSAIHHRCLMLLAETPPPDELEARRAAAHRRLLVDKKALAAE